MNKNIVIKLKLIPITKLGKKLDEAYKVISFNKCKNVNETYKYLKDNKVELFKLLDKHYKSYLDKFDGFEIIILENNKEIKSITFIYKVTDKKIKKI